PRVSPPEPVASRALVVETRAAKRRQASRWAMGHAAPKPLAFPEAEGPVFPAGNHHPRRELFLGREGLVSGGVCAQGTHAEDGPVPGEAPWGVLTFGLSGLLDHRGGH